MEVIQSRSDRSFAAIVAYQIQENDFSRFPLPLYTGSDLSMHTHAVEPQCKRDVYIEQKRKHTRLARRC